MKAQASPRAKKSPSDALLLHSPETMGLPSACLYLLLLFLFIPCRYFVQASTDARFPSLASGSNSKLHAVAEAVGVGMARGAAIDRMDFDGGWNGLMSGRMDFPHHEVRRVGPRRDVC